MGLFTPTPSAIESYLNVILPKLAKELKVSQQISNTDEIEHKLDLIIELLTEIKHNQH